MSEDRATSMSDERPMAMRTESVAMPARKGQGRGPAASTCRRTGLGTR